MKAYKVVGPDLKSARCGYVQYKVGVWVTPNDADVGTIFPNSRLFVFTTLESAKEFTKTTHGGGPHERIFECEVRGGIRGQGCDNVSSIDDFWKFVNSLLRKKKKITKIKPKGIRVTNFKDVLLVKAIKLTKEIV